MRRSAIALLCSRRSLSLWGIDVMSNNELICNTYNTAPTRCLTGRGLLIVMMDLNSIYEKHIETFWVWPKFKQDSR